MQETFIVSVQTEDGKCLIQKKITGDYSALSFVLWRLSHAYLHRSEDLKKSETLLGSGITQSASDSSSPTQS